VFVTVLIHLRVGLHKLAIFNPLDGLWFWIWVSWNTETEFLASNNKHILLATTCLLQIQGIGGRTHAQSSIKGYGHVDGWREKQGKNRQRNWNSPGFAVEETLLT
jgi:hypothetical protein